MLEAQVIPYTLKFNFQAGTSRGIMKDRKSWFIRLWHKDDPTVFGVGEAGPLPGLSADDNEAALEHSLVQIVERINEFDNLEIPVDALLTQMGIEPDGFPSIVMAVETAVEDLKSNGKRLIFNNQFHSGQHSIPINGLIWMGDRQFMLNQVNRKLDEGFNCIKIKVGALDFESELKVIKYLRSKAPTSMEIRLDANGAFNKTDVLAKLDQLSAFHIHSIEQPVRQQQWNLMAKVIRESPIPIALDEELIGIQSDQEKEDLLQRLQPHYIILKPSLLGGFSATNKWIELAQGFGIGWWVTSALESNIGLNAICQFTAQYKNALHQGLGTGSLYQNNIRSPLEVKNQYIHYDPSGSWDLRSLLQ